QEVLEAICRINGVFTQVQLADFMERESQFCVSRSTLFHTLDTLVAARLLLRHSLGRAAAYELLVNTAPRAYLVCQTCGEIRVLERPELIKYLSTIKARLFSVHQPLLYLHGECKKCVQRARKSKKNSLQTIKQKQG
nr:transcriptional repressor [Bacteroidaceae bacterium]